MIDPHHYVALTGSLSALYCRPVILCTSFALKTLPKRHRYKFSELPQRVVIKLFIPDDCADVLCGCKSSNLAGRIPLRGCKNMVVHGTVYLQVCQRFSPNPKIHFNFYEMPQRHILK